MICSHLARVLVLLLRETCASSRQKVCTSVYSHCRPVLLSYLSMLFVWWVPFIDCFLSCFLPFHVIVSHLVKLAFNMDGSLDDKKAASLAKLFRPDKYNKVSFLSFVQSCDSVYKNLRVSVLDVRWLCYKISMVWCVTTIILDSQHMPMS
jgi:hypothetical protein